MELNKAVIDCMQSLRRRLRAELAIDIRLSQPDAVPAMLNACMASHNAETRQLGEHLAIISETPLNKTVPAPTQAPHTSPSTSYKVYRGQRVYS